MESGDTRPFAFKFCWRADGSGSIKLACDLMFRGEQFGWVEMDVHSLRRRGATELDTDKVSRFVLSCYRRWRIDFDRELTAYELCTPIQELLDAHAGQLRPEGGDGSTARVEAGKEAVASRMTAASVRVSAGNSWQGATATLAFMAGTFSRV